jgi:tRNA pseudouridine32 synthase/23S rRNA pseudouridine746 synthase
VKEILNSQDPKVLLENEDLAITFKPSNLLSVRSRFHKENPLPNLIDHLSVKTSQSLLPVHRLDFEVAGLILLAKNKKTQSILSQYFEKRTIHKTYLALSLEVDFQLFEKLPFDVEKVEIQKEKKFEWKSKILRGKKRSYTSLHGDPCLTHSFYKGSQKIQFYTIHQWELNPLTGRSHQLRFEMAQHSHPIIGDELYFAPLSPSYKKGIALVAQKLNFSKCAAYQKLGIPEEFSLDITWSSILEQVKFPSAQSIAQ